MLLLNYSETKTEATGASIILNSLLTLFEESFGGRCRERNSASPVKTGRSDCVSENKVNKLLSYPCTGGNTGGIIPSALGAGGGGKIVSAGFATGSATGVSAAGAVGAALLAIGAPATGPFPGTLISGAFTGGITASGTGILPAPFACSGASFPSARACSIISA